jgi:transcription-repair coupling factor (superfamily II helicase)
MGGEKLEEVMTAFIEHQFDVLVSTTIVESGLDIPNANTIIINEANKYGLSELHQMRGRVGRSNRKAFCYLIAPPDILLTSDARKRLKAMEEFTELGSGFQIAMRDLDIRGAGDLLGGEQSGFIGEIGYEMYNRILDEAIIELKEEHFADLFQEEISNRRAILVEDVHVDLDLDIKIPDKYIPSMAERLNFYRKIAFATKEEDFHKIQIELIDRFGPLTAPVLNLFDATRIREVAKRCGIEKIALKSKILRLYFIANQNSPFYSSDIPQIIIEYVGLFSGKILLKQTPKGAYLLMDEIDHTKQILQTLEHMYDFILSSRKLKLVAAQNLNL